MECKVSSFQGRDSCSNFNVFSKFCCTNFSVRLRHVAKKPHRLHRLCARVCVCVCVCVASTMCPYVCVCVCVCVCMCVWLLLLHFSLQRRDTELKVASGVYICSCECTSHIQFGTVLHANTHGVAPGMMREKDSLARDNSHVLAVSVGSYSDIISTDSACLLNCSNCFICDIMYYTRLCMLIMKNSFFFIYCSWCSFYNITSVFNL